MSVSRLVLPLAVMAVASLAGATGLGGAASAADAATQQEPAPDVTTVNDGDSTATTPPTTVAPIVTSTLPEGNGEVGRIIPLPNSGVEPKDPGDRGGWQQLTLFILVCAVIVGMGVFVWWRSRTARRERRAAGHDPVAMARAHGADVRKPRPPGITD